MEKEIAANEEEIVETEEEIIEESELEEAEEVPVFLEEGPEMVPVGAISKVKKKLKGRIAEKEEENRVLRKQLEEIQSSVPQIPTRPKALDFDSDEEYEKALDDWYDKKHQVSFQALEEKQRQQQDVVKVQQRVRKSVDDHYARAEKLVNEHSINPEVYQKADTVVRETTEFLRPGQGDSSVDQLIDILGEDSEKAIFYLGRNKTALNEYKSLLQEDHTGLKAAAYLGRLAERAKGTRKRTSTAPPPSTQVNGNANVSSSESALKKKYDAATKKGNAQEAWNIRSKARRSGVNTSNW